MLLNFIIGGLIFFYASWTIYKFVKKSKAGKCASCSEAKRCTVSTCDDNK